jgi:hypothetical protein
MFHEFSKTELSRRDFLLQMGINPSSGSASRNTSDWEGRRIRLHVVTSVAVSGDDFLGHPSADTCGNSLPTLEAPDTIGDYDRLAQILSQQLESLLEGRNDNATGPTQLSVNNIAKLTSVLAQLQLIRQRAKGLWGQNLPRNHDEVGSASDVSVTGPLKAPIYEVQMNSSGKFKRARPVLVGYYDLSQEADDGGSGQYREPYYVVEMKNSQTGLYERCRPRPSSFDSE